MRLMAALTAAFAGTGQPVPGAGNAPSGGYLPRRPGDVDQVRLQPGRQRPAGRSPIWYLEDGFETVVPPDEARATRAASRTVSSCSRVVATADDRRCATRRASSGTRSSSPTASRRSARSSTSSSSTRSGSGAGSRACSGPDGTPKPSYELVKAALAAVAAGAGATAPGSRPSLHGVAPTRRRPIDVATTTRRGLPYPRRGAAGSRLRRRFHARPARPRPRAGGLPALGLRYGLDLDPRCYDQARAAAFAEVKRHPGARPRRGDLGAASPSGSSSAWAATGDTLRGGASRWSGAGRSRRTSSSTTTRCRCSATARARPHDRPALELGRATWTSSSRTTASSPTPS